ncbi:MAG TPA: hypothetical protein VNM72_15355 [Blastocatellia bacterium]|nr:hypothetical protein [Blastocatellia bacterium]
MIDSKGNPWFCEFGTHKLARVNPATGEITEFTLPRADARPHRIAIASDDAVWYTDFQGGRLGRFDPVTSQARE